MTNQAALNPNEPPVPTAEEILAEVERVPAKIIGTGAKVLFIVALAFSAFQIYTAAFTPFSSLVIRAYHVGFLLFLTFAFFGAKAGAERHYVPWYDWILAVVAFALGAYQMAFEGELIQRAGDPSTLDLIVGSLNLLLIFEASRRIMGWGLPIFCLVFIAYAFLGQYLPSPLNHRGYGFEQVIDQLAMSTEGIYGIPTLVSATYIFLFVLFGAFLEKAGMISLFSDVALGTVGHTRGGPAKVAVIASGMMGTINGSGIANVVTTGQFTIPLMKRFGYRPAFAGAVEATAAMGGQIMPPVMGAVAFIMAETINVPYVEICIAAAIPAILYYVTAFWVVHLEAGRAGLRGMTKEECPSAVAALKRQWHLLLPLGALVFLLFSGYTPLFAGTAGLALTAIFIIGSTIAANLNRTVARMVFWAILGIASWGLFQAYGIGPVMLMIGVLVAVSFWVKGGPATLMLLTHSLVDGAKTALSVGIACALVGTVIGVFALTGMATSIAGVTMALGEKSLFLSLVLTMIISIVLGTGLPTIPSYIITAAMAAPALLKLGVPLIVSHMFVFYFGIMADLTPPVALAALAAAPIARAGHQEIGWLATRIAAAGFVVPFMAVYAPELMLQGDNVTIPAVAYILIKALLAIGLWGGTAIGYLIGPMSWLERIVAGIAALFLVANQAWTDEIGFALSAAVIGWHWWQNRARPATA